MRWHVHSSAQYIRLSSQLIVIIITFKAKNILMNMFGLHVRVQSTLQRTILESYPDLWVPAPLSFAVKGTRSRSTLAVTVQDVKCPAARPSVRLQSKTTKRTPRASSVVRTKG